MLSVTHPAGVERLYLPNEAIIFEANITNSLAPAHWAKSYLEFVSNVMLCYLCAVEQV